MIPPLNKNKISYGLRLGVDFISPLIVGVLLGHFFDTLLSSSPWCMLIFIVLGIFASFLNLKKATKNFLDPQKGNLDD